MSAAIPQNGTAYFSSLFLVGMFAVVSCSSRGEEDCSPSLVCCGDAPTTAMEVVGDCTALTSCASLGFVVSSELGCVVLSMMVVQLSGY